MTSTYIHSIYTLMIGRGRTARGIGLALACTLFVWATVAAQAPRNYVYLFDCTSSMLQGDQPIFKPAKEALRKTISLQAQQPGARFTIVAFKYKTTISDGDTLAFKGTEYGSAKQTEIDSLLQQAINGEQHNTNIVSALKKGFDLCNPAMENRIYLFTDGKHNSTGSVEQCLANWCADHPAGSRLFYVMMTPDAVDDNVLRCLEACEDGFAVQCKNGCIPQIIDIGSQLTASTIELDQDYAISFSEADPVLVDIKCDDPFFNVRLSDKNPRPYTLRLRLDSQNDLSPEALNQELAPFQDADGNYEFSFEVTSADKRYYVANPTVWVCMKNQPPRKLSLFGGNTDSVAQPTRVRWYDSFLWCKAAPDQAVEMDFAPIFQSPDANTFIAFAFSDIDSGNPADYTLTFNGKPLSPGEPITLAPHDTKAKLSLVFNHKAKEGNRNFVLTPVRVSHLDIVNGMSAEAFAPIAVNLSYSVEWNPLMTLCFWLAIAIIALLIMWLLIVKPLKYPLIVVAKLQVTGDGLYVSKRVKGCRCIVLSAHRQHQSFLSRCFTGKILYECRPAFTQDIHAVKGPRRSLRFQLPEGWGITPSATVARNQQATLINSDTGQQYTINVF